MPLGRKKFCCEDCKVEYQGQMKASPNCRHAILLRILDKERVPKHDMLRHLEYYDAVTAGNCIYCENPNSGSGHRLDRIDNSKGHFCWNVLAPVCSDCNGIRGNILTVEEMFKLRPALIEIRKDRESEREYKLGIRHKKIKEIT